MSRFIHLHTHSHYSLLSALPKIPELVRAAKERGMEALALTDNGNLYGAIEFYKECQKQSIKPIIGVDFYLATRTRHDKEMGVDNRRSRLVLLAKNFDGYQNLIRLVTTSHLEGFYYKPRIDRELMGQYAEGLIAIIPSFSSEVSVQVRAADIPGTTRIVNEYKNIYGTENVYLEITHHPEIEGHEALQKKIVALGGATGTPIVAAHDTYYLSPNDRPARDTLLSIQSGGVLEKKGAFADTAELSFISSDDAERFFLDIPDALENTLKIADRCTLTLELGNWMFPKFEIPENATYQGELRRLAYEGFARHGLAQTPAVEERLEYELSIIEKKGYAPYFLVVADLLREAHDHGIYTNIRGSVAGSLTTYLAGITTIDPLEYQLPFERFLNPERPSPPDIDMDFADNRRDEMIAYVRKKYGEGNVAQIGTFGTMMARGSVRDTARALGFDYALGDRISKLIPFGSQGSPMTIDTALEREPDLKKLYTDEEDVQRIIDMARKIEGCARHISVHAAGVVISPVPLCDIVPVQFDPKGEGKIITQYDMHAIEDVGLLKFDFLGLKNLAVLADAVQRVETGTGQSIDIEKIPLDDKKTYEMLGRGETVGVFQLASGGMTHYIKELKPTEIHDINAMVALYRPGPMESIPQYIARKYNPKLVTYLDPRMAEILERSYGVITYQDDVLLIAIHLAGYSWLEADKLRKAMGKKIPREMAAQKEKFISGGIDHGLSPEKAMQLWALIEPFAAYGFNKAHAASYGRLAYQTAYMKANYPALYMAAVLTADSGNIDEVSIIIDECKRMHLDVLPPDINESAGDFTIITGSDGREKIRFGLHSIKNVGEGIADVIIHERIAHGIYQSVSDFLMRARDRNLNKKSLEALIMCGAMDSLGERGQLLGNMDTLLAFNRAAQAESVTSHDSLFGGLAHSIPHVTLDTHPHATPIERLGWEKELLGLYVSGHPMAPYREKVPKEATPIGKITANSNEASCTIAGIAEGYKAITTKNGEHMAFVKITDETGAVECVIFPRTLRATKFALENNPPVIVTGKTSLRNGTLSIIAEKIQHIDRSTGTQKYTKKV